MKNVSRETSTSVCWWFVYAPLYQWLPARFQPPEFTSTYFENSSTFLQPHQPFLLNLVTHITVLLSLFSLLFSLSWSFSNPAAFPGSV